MMYKHVMYYYRSSTGSFAKYEQITDSMEDVAPPIPPDGTGWKLYSHSTEFYGE